MQAARVTFSYTDSGRRASMSDGSGVTLYGYDSRDRLTSKATPQGTLGYSYDDASNLASIATSTAEGASMAYRYDDLNRLDAVTGTNNQLTDYSYDANGNLEAVALPNRVTSAYGYNALNRLTALRHTGPVSVLFDAGYGLAPSGHRVAISESGAAVSPANPTAQRTRQYSYDALWRLSSETLSGSLAAAANGAVSYTHDAVGNRRVRTSTIAALSSQTFNYDANDRVAGDTSDANGNTRQGSVSQPSPLNSQHLLGSDSYDSENRLTTRAAGNGSVAILYDGDGNKVRETVTRNGLTTVTTYLVDDLNPTGYAQVVEEKTNGTLTRAYTYGHDLISMDQLQGTAWKLSHYGYDGHGSVRFLTDEVGLVTDTYDYDAFGQLLAAGGTTANSYLYCGEQFDSALGLYYLRARLMNPLTGRFWNADSYEGSPRDAVSLHKYLYAASDPANRMDPSGFRTMGELAVAQVNNLTVANGSSASVATFNTAASYTAYSTAAAALMTSYAVIGWAAVIHNPYLIETPDQSQFNDFKVAGYSQKFGCGVYANALSRKMGSRVAYIAYRLRPTGTLHEYDLPWGGINARLAFWQETQDPLRITVSTSELFTRGESSTTIFSALR